LRTAIGVPPELARRANRVLRPRDAAVVYAHPRAELARLAQRHAAVPLAAGYYALVPMNRLGEPGWTPALDAVALGIAQTDYGVDAVALVSSSAARQHGAIPRALGVAVVAVPKQRPPLETAFGRVVFTKRDTSVLDVQRVTTELTEGWVTTPEQTALDLAARPKLSGLPQSQVDEAVRSLAQQADPGLLADLAAAQRHPGALRYIRSLSGEAGHA
jgi:AbiEi antitoxin C-terminal domain